MGKDSKSNNGLKDTRHEDVMRELRVHSRELRELRKTLKNILEIMQAQESDRLEGEDAELPIYHRAHPDYSGPQPNGYVAPIIPEVLDDFVDIRDMGVTQ